MRFHEVVGVPSQTVHCERFICVQESVKRFICKEDSGRKGKALLQWFWDAGGVGCNVNLFSRGVVYR